MKKWISRCDDHAPKAPRAVWTQCAECSRHFQYSLHITKEPIREQEINLECMNSQEFLHMLTIDTFQFCVSFHMHSANKWMWTLDLWIYNIWVIYMLYFKLICCLCFVQQLENMFTVPTKQLFYHFIWYQLCIITEVSKP